MRKAIVLLLFVFGLTGCASAPTQEQIANADYGRYQSSKKCVEIAEEVIRNSLKDPISALFTHGACMRSWWGGIGKSVAYGYLQRGTVNGKNSYGGYVGARKYAVLIKNGYAIRWCVTDYNGLCIP